MAATLILHQHSDTLEALKQTPYVHQNLWRCYEIDIVWAPTCGRPAFSHSLSLYKARTYNNHSVKLSTRRTLTAQLCYSADDAAAAEDINTEIHYSKLLKVQQRN